MVIPSSSVGRMLSMKRRCRTGGVVERADLNPREEDRRGDRAQRENTTDGRPDAELVVELRKNVEVPKPHRQFERSAQLLRKNKVFKKM
jgi:hypothetical protein